MSRFLRTSVLHAAAALGLLLCSGPVSQAAIVNINFDVDANNNPINAPGLFNQTTRLTTLYSSLGITFQGPGGNNGAAILNQSGNFGLPAKSGVNFLAFNDFATMSDGGTPTGPETMLFSTAVSSVSLFAGDSSPVTFQMQAFNSLNLLVATDVKISPSNQYVQMTVAGSDITRVVFQRLAGNTFYVIDDLSFDTAQVQAVPAPPAIILGGLGALGLIGWRRRRSAQVA